MRRIFAMLSGMVAVLLLVCPQAMAVPNGHERMLQDEEYSACFNEWTATVQEAEKRLPKAEFKKISQSIAREMDIAVREDMEGGSSEMDAWIGAYIMGNTLMANEITNEWLRCNAKGVQGFYRMKHEKLEGYLTVIEGDQPASYEVKLTVNTKKDRLITGDLDGLGKLDGKTMQAFDKNCQESPVTILFKGDKATVSGSNELIENGFLAENLSFDAEYTRERR